MSERPYQYLAWNGACILDINSVLIRCVDLLKTIVNHWLYYLQSGTLKVCSNLETNRSSILHLNIEEGRVISTL